MKEKYFICWNKYKITVSIMTIVAKYIQEISRLDCLPTLTSFKLIRLFFSVIWLELIKSRYITLHCFIVYACTDRYIFRQDLVLCQPPHQKPWLADHHTEEFRIELHFWSRICWHSFMNKMSDNDSVCLSNPLRITLFQMF